MQVSLTDYYVPHEKQLFAHQTATPYVLFGGAMGGGKSWYLSAEAVINAMKYPGNRLAIVRKIRRVMENTIVVTFFQVCPPELIKKFNVSKLSVTFINGSELLFMEADRSKDPLLNKIKGLEIGWCGIDEANEVDEEVFNIIKSRLRWKCPKIELENGEIIEVIPNYQIRLTSNPENCWLVPRFIENPEPGHKFIQSLTTDNYDENSQYVKQLMDAFKHHPELLERYLGGHWTFGSGIAQLIRNELIEFMMLDVEHNQDHTVMSMGVDVARYGDDNTCFVIMRGGRIIHIEVWTKTSTVEVAKRTMALMEEYDILDWKVGVDVIGIGAGVVDTLIEAGQNVCPITAGAAPEVNIHNNEFKFLQPYNFRAQMFMAFKNDVAGRIIGDLPNCKFYLDGVPQGQNMLDKFRKELGWIEYNLADGRKLKILKKEEIKKKHGKSPDIADASAICNWMRRKEFAGFAALF